MPRKTANTMTVEQEFKLSPKAEAFNLAMHGTSPAQLSPRNLIQTAESDLRAKARNSAIAAERRKPRQSQSGLADESFLPYAFTAHIVENSWSVVQILELAVQFRRSVLCLGIENKNEREAAQRKLPLSTFRVYQDEATLVEALHMVPLQDYGIAP